MGEKATVHLTAPIGNLLALEEINEGDGAVVVPVENGDGTSGSLRHSGQIGILAGSVLHHHLTNTGPGAPRGDHSLGVTVFVLLNKGLSSADNLLGGAVIGFHVQHLRLGIDLLKVEQGLGIRCSKAIDALVLISHHEQIPTVLSQVGDDGVLDFRGVLGLIHTKISVSCLELAEDWRTEL